MGAGPASPPPTRRLAAYLNPWARHVGAGHSRLPARRARVPRTRGRGRGGGARDGDEAAGAVLVVRLFTAADREPCGDRHLLLVVARDLAGRDEVGDERFFRAFEAGFEKLRQGYLGGAARVIRFWPVALAAFACLLGAILLMFRILPSSFVPDEDQGYFFVVAQVQDAANLGVTSRFTSELEKIK